MAEGFFTWSKYWLREDSNDTDETWTDALKYVESIPQCEAVDLTIDADSLESAIASTPSNSARGLSLNFQCTLVEGFNPYKRLFTKKKTLICKKKDSYLQKKRPLFAEKKDPYLKKKDPYF